MTNMDKAIDGELRSETNYIPESARETAEWIVGNYANDMGSGDKWYNSVLDTYANKVQEYVNVQLEESKARIKELEEVLTFYADENLYFPRSILRHCQTNNIELAPIYSDFGEKAKNVLKIIDITKPVYTNNGHRVLNLHYVPYDSNGTEVTYPLKGTLVMCEKPLKTRYEIWSKFGKVDVVFGRHAEWDIKNEL